MFKQGKTRAVIINLLQCFLTTHSRAITKSDARIRNVQSSEPISVTTNEALFMRWKRYNQNTCSERVFRGNSVTKYKNFPTHFLSNYRVFLHHRLFYAIIAIKHAFLMHKHLPVPSGS